MKPSQITKEEKKCDWCGKPLRGTYFIDSKSKKSFHFGFQGKDCLQEFCSYEEKEIISLQDKGDR